MRSLTIATATALSLAAFVTMAPAKAKAQTMGPVHQLSALLTEVERVNMGPGRPNDEVKVAIAHQIDMLRDRIQDIYLGRLHTQQAVSMINESLVAISQYNNNGGQFAAPWAVHRINNLVAQMKALLPSCAGSGGFGGGGFGGGYGQGGGFGGNRWGNGYGYVQPPRPAYRGGYRTSYYVPAPPASIYGTGNSY